MGETAVSVSGKGLFRQIRQITIFISRVRRSHLRSSRGRPFGPGGPHCHLSGATHPSPRSGHRFPRSTFAAPCSAFVATVRLGRRVAGPPGRRAAGPPGRRVAGPPGRRVAGSPGRRVAGSILHECLDFRPERPIYPDIRARSSIRWGSGTAVRFGPLGLCRECPKRVRRGRLDRDRLRLGCSFRVHSLDPLRWGCRQGADFLHLRRFGSWAKRRFLHLNRCGSRPRRPAATPNRPAAAQCPRCGNDLPAHETTLLIS